MAGYNPMSPLYGQGITYNTVSNIYYSGTADPWPSWNQYYIQATATVSTASTVVMTWGAWNQAYTDGQQMQAQPVEIRTQVHRAEREALEEEAMRAAKAAADAAIRANELLLRFLSPEQQRTWKESNNFIVQAASHRYRLSRTMPPARMTPDGQFDTQYCIHTYGIPREDELLGFKLLLEADEAQFLRVANATRLAVTRAA